MGTWGTPRQNSLRYMWSSRIGAGEVTEALGVAWTCSQFCSVCVWSSGEEHLSDQYHSA